MSKIRSNPLFLAFLTATVALAGCIGDEEAPISGTNGETVELGSRGAINGLVVDDNYRPVQLKEEWGNAGPGEFQDLGFVLILETGQRFDTTENGEFQVLPLEPGTYTIRVAADNHEAKDTKVNVVSGEYTEITLEARRQYSSGGSILSQEEVIFIACSANVGVLSIASIPGGCGDASGDSERFDFPSDYTAIAPDIRGLVTEMRASQEGYYGILIRTFDAGCDSTLGDCIFSEPEVSGGKYIHNVLYPGLQYVSKGEYLEEGEEGYCVAPDDVCRNYAFDLQWPFQTALFPEAASREHTDVVYDEFNGASSGTTGVTLNNLAYGVTLGTKAQFLQTVFLYELPEEGIEEHCALCSDAEIPE